ACASAASPSKRKKALTLESHFSICAMKSVATSRADTRRLFKSANNSAAVRSTSDIQHFVIRFQRAAIRQRPRSDKRQARAWNILKQMLWFQNPRLRSLPTLCEKAGERSWPISPKPRAPNSTRRRAAERSPVLVHGVTKERQRQPEKRSSSRRRAPSARLAWRR